MHVRCVLTRAAQQFVTPLAASALADERCYTDLFDPQSEFDAGHIRLARDCDLIVVAPATADLMAKMANGHADDLATAILLATDRPILLAPAMNPLMWSNAATRRNVAAAASSAASVWSVRIRGAMAEAGEAGVGRMSEPLEIAAAAEQLLAPQQCRTAARHDACWSPQGQRTSRSIRCATSPIARRASRAMRSPRPRPPRARR